MRIVVVTTALLVASISATPKAEAATAGSVHIEAAPASGKPEPPPPVGVAPPEAIGAHGCAGYPAAAIRDRATGVTQVSFRITTDGKVTSPRVHESSENDALDQASILCVTAWQYKPATLNGLPLEVQWETGITWNAPAFATNEPEDQDNQISVPVWARGGFRCEQWYAVGSQKPPHHAILTFSVERDGSVKDVALTQSSGSDKIDADAIQCLQQRRYQPAKQHGEAIEYRLTESLY